MPIKSIDYEYCVSSLIDACSVVESRAEDIDIKKSFSTKQFIYSNILHKRLLNFLSGEDPKFKIILEKFFDILQESMKNTCSSPFLMKMQIADFNTTFRSQFIFPFLSLLLFNLRDKMPTTSPLFYFNEFISNSNQSEPVDALVRSYLRNELLNANFTDYISRELRIFIKTISIKSSLKINKTNEFIKSFTDLKSIDAESKNKLVLFSIKLYSMRLVLFFKEHISIIKMHYEHARDRDVPKDIWFWEFFEKLLNTVISNDLLFRLNNVTDFILPTLNKLSVQFYNNVSRKYNIDIDHELISIIEGKFYREDVVKQLDKNKSAKKSVYEDMLYFYLKVYDGCFDEAITHAKKIIKDTEVYPKCRMISTLSKLILALVIKTNGSTIKNNTLDPHVYRIISSDIFRERLHVQLNAAFINQESSFFNDVYAYTIIDSLMEWNVFISEKFQIMSETVTKFDVIYLDKIELILSKIYCELDKRDVCLSSISENLLREILSKSISLNERTGNLITFIPNMNLYQLVRDIHFIASGVSDRELYNSPCVSKFICDESSESKRKLLKVIDADKFKMDEKNELAFKQTT